MEVEPYGTFEYPVDEGDDMPQDQDSVQRRTHLNVRISADANRMLTEMLQTWFPGKVRVQGALVERAILLLYKQFKREQKHE